MQFFNQISVDSLFKDVQRMDKRQHLYQFLSFGMIVSSALMIWKGLMVVTGSESPIVVVLSGSMEPAFHRGDLLFLTNFREEPVRVGEIVVFKVEGRDIPIVHRVLKLHEKHNGTVKFLTKGDNNSVDDRGLYAPGQLWLTKNDVVGRARGVLPYVGMITIYMNEYPNFKSAFITLIYVLCQNYMRKKFNVAPLIYATMIIGCIATLCMAFMYQQTTVIWGTKHSFAWLVNMFLFALVGCLSSVVFMPYMGRFIQGIGGPLKCIPNNSTDGPAFIKEIPTPLFGPQVYFLFIFAIMVASTLAFVLLNNSKICKNELAVGDALHGNDYSYDQIEKDRECDVPIPDDVRNLSKSNYVSLIAAEGALNCIGNGLFPGLHIYSSLPYGDWAYHFTVNLSAISNPVACFVAMLVPRTSIRKIRTLSCLATLLAVYIVFISLNSPKPPMIDSIFGPILIIVCWTAFYAVISFMKTSITSIFRYQEGKSLVLIGTIGQMSAAGGAAIGFILINYTNWFKSSQPC